MQVNWGKLSGAEFQDVYVYQWIRSNLLRLRHRLDRQAGAVRLPQI